MTLHDVRRSLDRAPLGAILAVAFASALAFAIFAAPDWRLAQAVSATGLPAILPAAAPPPIAPSSISTARAVAPSGGA
ncbi:MAG: hypothetical protein EOP68_23940, partial [Sphingomonas sp.]